MPKRLSKSTSGLFALIALSACGGTDVSVESGWLRVQTVTSGSDFDDSYSLTVATPTGDQNQPSFGPNQTVVLNVTAGDSHLAIDSIDNNCTLSGNSVRTVRVTPNDTGATTFSLTCAAVGGYISVHTGFAGVDRDVSGYELALDDNTLSNRRVHVVDSVEYRKLPAGTHTVKLRDIAANCSTPVDTVQSATLGVGDSLHIVWNVTCVEVAPRALLMTFGRLYLRRLHDTMLVDLTPAAGSGAYTFYSPVWSPNGQRIVVTGAQSSTGTSQVYVMNADGSGQVQLTTDPRGNHSPRWSPDGTRIAFVGARDPARNQIFVMNADGTNPTRLTIDTAHQSSPSWSPDGARIAYVRGCAPCTPSTSDLYVFDGTDTTRLTFNGRVDFRPVWSPDGARIAFNVGEDTIGIVDADGSNPVFIPTEHSWSEPSWSPDGTQLVYVRDRYVHRVGFDGTGDTTLAFGFYPTWSPDGSSIAFAQLDGCSGYSCQRIELTVMKPDGSRIVRLTRYQRVASPVWAP